MTVPAGETRIVTLDPTTSWDGVLFELAACDSATCSSNADDSASGGNEQLTFVNTGATDATHIIGVQAYSGAGGTFTLTVAEPPYTQTAISEACVDVSAGTALGSTTVDDAMSPGAMLPFAFSFFGTPVTHWRASTNGWMQLSASSSFGATDTFAGFSNDRIPTSDDPDGVIAPFWDDLRPRTGANITQLVTGAAGSQMLVVQWSQWRPSSSGGEDLTFQVVLHESTSVIELRYCSLTNSGSGSLHTGSSATIGIENLDGSDGVLTSFETADAVMTGSGFRYTPN